MSNTETISISYDVLDSNAEIIRSGKVRGTFPDDTAYIDMVDDLLELAYEKEMTYDWSDSYCILEA